MKTRLIVCHARPGDAYEIQTDETPHRLVAGLFHNGNDPGRLSMEEAAVYASIFAAAPELLEACKADDDWLRQNIPAVNRPAWLDKLRIDAIAKATGI